MVAAISSARCTATAISSPRPGRAAHNATLALDYRLAPEHPFPAAVEVAVANYLFLLALGIAPERMTLAGDSVGCRLVVAAMLAIRGTALPQLACGWCILPWVDVEGIGASMASKAANDPRVENPRLVEMAKLYLGRAISRSPAGVPVCADRKGLAPLLIQAVEMLLDDVLRLNWDSRRR